MCHVAGRTLQTTTDRQTDSCSSSSRSYCRSFCSEFQVKWTWMCRCNVVEQVTESHKREQRWARERIQVGSEPSTYISLPVFLFWIHSPGCPCRCGFVSMDRRHPAASSEDTSHTQPCWRTHIYLPQSGEQGQKTTCQCINSARGEEMCSKTGRAHLQNHSLLWFTFSNYLSTLSGRKINKTGVFLFILKNGFKPFCKWTLHRDQGGDPKISNHSNYLPPPTITTTMFLRCPLRHSTGEGCCHSGPLTDKWFTVQGSIRCLFIIIIRCVSC